MVHADAASLPAFITTKAAFYEHISSQLEALLSDQRNWVSNLSNASSVLYASLNRFQARLEEVSRAASGERKSGEEDKAVYRAKPINWAGFYLLSPFLPQSTAPTATLHALRSESKPRKRPTLLLGPFCGLPACQQIQSIPGKGVCADASALLPPRAVRVDKTDDYPGHIACDSASRSEIVVPLVISRSRQLSTHHQAALRGALPQSASTQESLSQDLSKQDSAPRGSEEDASSERASKSQKLEVPVEWQGRGDDDEIIIGVLDIDCEDEDGFDSEDEEGLTRIAKIITDACDW